jgi:RNA polymerase sigma-70 factor (ECF subfamily)
VAELALNPPLWPSLAFGEVPEIAAAVCIAAPVGRNLVRVSRKEGPSEELVARCKAGERAAFRDLFEHCRADVARLVFRMLGPKGDVEDVVQDVFVQLFRSIGDFRGEARFTTWLHRLAVNVVLMHRRAARSRPHLTDQVPAETEAAGPHPDEDAIRRERIRAFYAVLDKVADKKRTVFILHEIEGLAPAEIAKVVGAPVLTVRTRLFYARRDVIQLLRSEPSLASLADVMLRQGSADLASKATRESFP